VFANKNHHFTHNFIKKINNKPTTWNLSDGLLEIFEQKLGREK